MKELRLDEKLEGLFKPLPKETLEELEEKISKKYDGTPLYVWKDNILVDGHNRYPIMKKYNIDFNIANVEDFLGNNCTRADVMQWMISNQSARRNLSPGELITANSRLVEEIALENKEKMLEGTYNSHDVRKNNGCVHLDTPKTISKERDFSTNTRQQVAKMSGVGAGTIARYDAIMKAGSEDLKKKVQTGEVKIGTAYREIKTRTCRLCGKEKRVIDFFGNDTICKDCARKEADKNVNAPKIQSKSEKTENIKDVYEDVLTAKNAKDQINQDYELSWLKETCHDFVAQVNDRLFDLLCVVEKMDENHINDANAIFENFVSDVFDIQEKLNNKMKVEEE